MPELPEVESVRRGLTRARLRAPLRLVLRSALPLRIGAHWRDERLSLIDGAAPGRITRRGKYIVWSLEHPRHGRCGLLVHLGMSGRLTVTRPEASRAPHTHVVLRSADREIRFVDPRRFGGIKARLWDALWAEPPLHALGPEPLDRRFGGEALQEAAGRSQRVLRDVLLDQRVVAGVGNIYAVEALFEAGLHPLLPARRLAPSAWARLAASVVAVLRRAIENGGTTFRDFRGSDGEKGRNQDALWVYGRAGAPCLACGTTLRGFVHGGRSGAWCPQHQRRPKSRTVS